ncbi:hypothetical protein LZ30DRAFT_782342 [Colletotrichum cereale]|nr:hypothetical protein LZ30DRAFT_782342 [Colletotrichum cereale]
MSPKQPNNPSQVKAEVSKLAPTATEGDLSADSKKQTSSSPPKPSSGKGGAAGAKNSDGSPVAGPEKKRLKQVAEENLEAGNPTQLGDPVSLKAETSETEPRGEADGQRRQSKL